MKLNECPSEHSSYGLHCSCIRQGRSSHQCCHCGYERRAAGEEHPHDSHWLAIMKREHAKIKLMDLGYPSEAIEKMDIPGSIMSRVIPYGCLKPY